MNERLIDTVAAYAADHGWERPEGADHVLYVAHAVRALRTFADAGPAAVPAARALWWAYVKEARDLDPDDLCGAAPGALSGLDGDAVLTLALYAPGRLAVEISLLAAARRRTGRAQKLVSACRRIQLAGERAGHGPVGRAGGRGAYVRGDGRARGLFVLVRGGQIEGERGWLDFWAAVTGGGIADARPSSREYAAREADVDLWTVEGGEFS
jgi:hypothetical protein